MCIILVHNMKLKNYVFTLLFRHSFQINMYVLINKKNYVKYVFLMKNVYLLSVF